MTFVELLEQYKASSTYKALGDRSKREYKKHLERLSEMGSKLDLENDMQMQVAVARSRRHVDFWYDQIVDSGVTNYEKGRLVTFVKMLYRFAGMGDIIEALRLPKAIKHTRKDAHPLTKEDVARILDLDVSELRSYGVFVAFLFYTGMRPAEVFALKWEDVGDEFIVVMGSKHKEAGVPSRMIPILPEIGMCLDYCKTLGSQWVFVTNKRRPFVASTVCEKTREIFDLCKLDCVLYDTRRGIATEMYKQGYDLRSIANLLGHNSTKTTEGYLRLSMQQKARTYKGI